MKRWSLRLENSILDDAGNYTCIVKNIHGEIRWTYQVDIVGKKYFYNADGNAQNTF